MIIKKIVVGKFAVNCYVLMCEETKEVMVIDPGDQSQLISRTIKELQGKLKYILLTHGHGDHIGGVEALKKELGGEIIAAEPEQEMLLNPSYNESSRICDDPIAFEADYYVRHQEIMKLGKHEFKCLYTPGHTKGGMTVSIEGVLFTGDTLFRQSVGRTDLHGGSMQTLINSITSLLLPFSPETVVYPGHGAATTIGYEKKNNPFI